MIGAFDSSLRAYVNRVRDEATAAECLADLCRRWSVPVTPKRLAVPARLAPCPFCAMLPDTVDTGEVFESRVTGAVLVKRTCGCAALAIWR